MTQNYKPKKSADMCAGLSRERLVHCESCCGIATIQYPAFLKRPSRSAFWIALMNLHGTRRCYLQIIYDKDSGPWMRIVIVKTYVIHKVSYGMLLYIVLHVALGL
jgi:hypothetical protein